MSVRVIGGRIPQIEEGARHAPVQGTEDCRGGFYSRPVAFGADVICSVEPSAPLPSRRLAFPGGKDERYGQHGGEIGNEKRER